MDKIVLTTTNSKYIPIVSGLLETFWKFHPEIKMCVLCVNLKESEKQHLNNLHSNLILIEDNHKFPNEHVERNYCAHNRTWFMPALMKKYKCNIFWLDADVQLKGKIDPLFDLMKDVDFMIRAKTMQPFTCNCGMVWTKYSEKNNDILFEWAQEAKNLDVLNYWYADQKSLNKIIQKYYNELSLIDYRTFPEEYDGRQNNEKSIIIHHKGPKFI